MKYPRYVPFGKRSPQYEGEETQVSKTITQRTDVPPFRHVLNAPKRKKKICQSDKKEMKSIILYSLLSTQQWVNGGGVDVCRCVHHERNNHKRGETKNNLHNIGVTKKAKIKWERERATKKNCDFLLSRVLYFPTDERAFFLFTVCFGRRFPNFNHFFCSLSSMPFRRKRNARFVYFGERNSRMWRTDEQESHFAFGFGTWWQMHFVFAYTRSSSHKWKENTYFITNDRRTSSCGYMKILMPLLFLFDFTKIPD